MVIGMLGFLWVAVWAAVYEKPEQQKRLSAEELAYIRSDQTVQPFTKAPSGAPEKKVSWFKLLTYRQTWAFAFGKFMTDGVWWFFLFWLPTYLSAQYGMKGADIVMPLAVLYSMTMVGSIGGGWFPSYFMARGDAPYDGRMKAMLVIALFPLVVLLAQPLGYISFWVPVLLIGVGASAHQAWSCNIFTTVSDMFPQKTVASVVGIGGMAGGLGGVRDDQDRRVGVRLLQVHQRHPHRLHDHVRHLRPGLPGGVERDEDLGTASQGNHRPVKTTGREVHLRLTPVQHPRRCWRGLPWSG